MDALGDCLRGVEGDGVVHVRGKPLLQFCHELCDRFGRVDGVRAGQLIRARMADGLAVVPAGDVVGLRSQLDAGHVLQAHDRAVRLGAENDVAELLRGGQAALRTHGVGEFLTGGTGSPPICPAGFTLFCVWMALMISRNRIRAWPADPV